MNRGGGGWIRAGRVLGVVGLAATVAAFFGGHWWLLDLIANFRFQLGAGLLLVAAASWRSSSWPWRLALAAACGVNLALVAALYFPLPADPGAGPSRRLFLLNARISNATPGRVAEYLAAQRPDPACLQEVAPAQRPDDREAQRPIRCRRGVDGERARAGAAGRRLERLALVGRLLRARAWDAAAGLGARFRLPGELAEASSDLVELGAADTDRPRPAHAGVPRP